MSKLNRREFMVGASAAFISGIAPIRVQAKKRYDVIVVGAGLSGLNAAFILEEAGLNVLTLEGRNRVGGRVYTLMDLPGNPEGGGEFIGGNYARMIDVAKRLEVELVEPKPLGEGFSRYYNIRGQNIMAEEWADHPLNPMEGNDRNILPNRMLSQLALKDNPLLDRPDDVWLTPEFAKYDVPHTQYLKETLGLNDETIRLMNVIVHTDHMDNTSALHELRRYALGANSAKFRKATGLPGSLQVKGGNSLLPEAMAKSLKNGVMLQKTVVAFDDNGSEVEVICGDGTSYRAKQVICSMPCPVMRHVKFTPRLPLLMEQAIDEIDYGISIQVHFLLKRNFWEEDGLPPNIWSDSAFERFAVLRRGEDNTASTAIAFINGNDAFRYEFMGDQHAGEYTLQKLAEIRPSTKGALEPVLVQSCHRDPHGAGDWVFWRPGQVTKYGNNMRDRHGNIHFCGEHTAIIMRGMEGAFESGERAALDLLDRA